jgi:CAAX prenyl protease-like protein
MALLALRSVLPVGDLAEQILRIGVVTAVLLAVSRPVLDFRIRNLAATVGIGIAVFLIWIAPDALFPGWRSHWVFQNSITGSLNISLSEAARSDSLVLALRFARAALLVPIIEELFWRGWLMRWLIKPDFERVPLGAYSAGAFWITAVLFAAEHGPYWEVGLLAGIAYNAWMVKTRSLGDLILAHAITNALLSTYVLATGKWEFWM